MSDSPKPWLGPETGYTDLLDTKILEEIKKEAEAPRKYHPLRPSSAGSSARRLAYELAEYRLNWKYDKVPRRTPATYRLLKLGNSVEFVTIQTLKLLTDFSVRYRQQVVTLFKVKRGNGLPDEIIEGSCDWVLVSDKHKAICDAKSKKDGGQGKYRYWLKDIEKLKAMKSVTTISDTAVWVDDLPAFIEELDGDFLIDNMVQLNSYACTEFMRERGIDHGVIYRYNKNTSDHFEIRFRPSQAVQDAVKVKFDAVSLAVDKGCPEAVPCECKLGSMRAAYCDFAAYCHPGVDVKGAFFDKRKKPASSGTPKVKRIKKGE